MKRALTDACFRVCPVAVQAASTSLPALRSESRDFDLQWGPLCRTRVRLPPDGAAGLPKDPTQSEVEEHECSACKDEGQEGQAAAWCSTCKCALCTNHIAAHTMSGSGPTSHWFRDLPKSDSTILDEPSSVPVCVKHNSPLEYFCKKCNVAVCGGCVATELHAKVQAKAHRLKTVALPRAEVAISYVDQVSEP